MLLALTGAERFVLDEPAATGTPVEALFRDGLATITVLIWLAYFMNILVITVLGAFLPTFLRNFGALSSEHAAAVTSFYSISGISAKPPTSWKVSRRTKIAWSPVAIPVRRERRLMKNPTTGRSGVRPSMRTSKRPQARPERSS